MKHYKLIFISAAILLAGVFSYRFYQMSSNAVSELGIKPPFKELDIPYKEYVFSNDTSFTVFTETGTKIHIPAHSIKTSGDSTKSKALTLKLREFHGADDLFRSGIPMQVAGTDRFLQSAGMIDVSVYQDNIPASLKEGRSIEIDLASYKNAQDYDLYYLKNDRQWEVTNTFRTSVNPLKQTIRDRLATISIPPQDTTLPNEEFVFDVFIDTIHTQQLKELYGLRWRIPSEYVDAKLKNAMRVHWNKVSVERVNKRKQSYKLVFERDMYITDSDSSITKTFSVPAKPILFEDGDVGGRKSRKNNRNQIAEFEATVERLKQEEVRLSKQAELVNQFKINRFGVWNIDKATNEKDYMNISVGFDFEEMKGVDADGVIVYGVYKEINTVIPYKKSEWKQIRFPVNSSMRLIAVINDKNVAIAEYSEIRNTILTKGTTINLNTNKVSADKITWNH